MVPILVWRGQVVTSGADLHAVQNEELTNRKCRQAQAGQAFRVGCGGSGLGVTHNATFSSTWQVFETVRWAESWWRWEGGAAIHVASWLIVSQAVCVCVWPVCHSESVPVFLFDAPQPLGFIFHNYRTPALLLLNLFNFPWISSGFFFFLLSEFCHNVRKEFENMHFFFFSSSLLLLSRDGTKPKKR